MANEYHLNALHVEVIRAAQNSDAKLLAAHVEVIRTVTLGAATRRRLDMARMY